MSSGSLRFGGSLLEQSDQDQPDDDPGPKMIASTSLTIASAGPDQCLTTDSPSSVCSSSCKFGFGSASATCTLSDGWIGLATWTLSDGWIRFVMLDGWSLSDGSLAVLASDEDAGLCFAALTAHLQPRAYTSDVAPSLSSASLDLHRIEV